MKSTCEATIRWPLATVMAELGRIFSSSSSSTSAGSGTLPSSNGSKTSSRLRSCMSSTSTGASSLMISQMTCPSNSRFSASGSALKALSIVSRTASGIRQFDGQHQSLAFRRDRAAAVGDHGSSLRKVGDQVVPQVDLRTVLVLGQADDDLFHQVIVFSPPPSSSLTSVLEYSKASIIFQLKVK